MTSEERREQSKLVTDTPSARASASNTISNGLSKLHRDHYGRGPDTVRTVIGHDHVITFLEDLYIPVERTLLNAGEVAAVVETRLAFQRAMKKQFTAVVEDATGRKVRAFLSQVHVDPDISAEIFVLEPDTNNPAPENTG
jgi:uncharacterized protein YbcI